MKKLTLLPLSLLSFQALAEEVIVTPPVSTAVDLTPITSAVDYSTVITGILAVGGIMVGVYIAWKATKMILGATKTL